MKLPQVPFDWQAALQHRKSPAKHTVPALQRLSLIGNLAAAQWARMLSQDSALVFFNGQINFLKARLFFSFLFKKKKWQACK